MKRPSFQFYPGDWSSNPNLRRCTFAEKGIWLEVLCLMHDQPEYGVLRWPITEIAEAVKCRPADLLALVRKGVLKGDDKDVAEPFIYTPRSGRKDGAPVTLVPTQPGPVWYSSRMVKDEYLNTHRGELTRFGAVKNTPTKPPDPSPTRRAGEVKGDGKSTSDPPPDPSPTARQSDGPSSSSSSSASPRAREIHSEPIGSDAVGVADPVCKLPAKPPDPAEIIFGYGVPMLTAAGSSDKHARSFLGGLRKQHGDAAVVDRLRECFRAKPLQPLEWLAAALPPKGSAPTMNRQEALEADGKRVASEWLAQQGEAA